MKQDAAVYEADVHPKYVYPYYYLDQTHGGYVGIGSEQDTITSDISSSDSDDSDYKPSRGVNKSVVKSSRMEEKLLKILVTTAEKNEASTRLLKLMYQKTSGGVGWNLTGRGITVVVVFTQNLREGDQDENDYSL